MISESACKIKRLKINNFPVKLIFNPPHFSLRKISYARLKWSSKVFCRFEICANIHSRTVIGLPACDVPGNDIFYSKTTAYKTPY